MSAAQKSTSATETQDALEAIYDQIEKLHANGATPYDKATQAVIRSHYTLVSQFWRPSATEYAALGRHNLEDEGARLLIGHGNDEMVKFLADSISVYASINLK